MDLRVFVEPQQGATYADQLRLAQTAEACGYSAFFRSDHFLAMGREGLPGPTDAWLTLAALARETSRIRLGTLVTSVTFRHPALLAVQVAQVDEMSGGRVDLGLGAGWFEAEHSAHGIPFPSAPERFDLLEDALTVISGMWSAAPGERFSFEGRTLRITDSPALPKPVQRPRPPIVMGGGGKRRTPALAARFADEFNMAFPTVADTVAQFARVDEACRAIGRDPATVLRSVALVACVGRDEAELRRRADAIGREVEELRTNGLAGSPAEVVDRLGTWREQTGAERYYLQLLDISDVEHAELIAAEVMPQL
ncbi:LLM class F420-dependent oxidoreductase [Ornithinimicrobium tianjinense]|uniref:LLM class F420-dependent oxidoreductase n=1 Tax=Ornithinimicrobium tianjinense TaxID=1195761 RepID=A0A917BVZ2_9MICO|nr:LLM class F420-dependent oxidoreductase [Ornithinimicrobium tianjinense]GGF58997.1 LLM class F420-dependent oxidoreductase [Ornithinimicrobium tianjinense]